MKSIRALLITVSLLSVRPVSAFDAMSFGRNMDEAVMGLGGLLAGLGSGLFAGAYAGCNPGHVIPAGGIGMLVAVGAGHKFDGMDPYSDSAKFSAAVGAAIGFSAMYTWTRMMRSSAHAPSNEPHTHSKAESELQPGTAT